MHEPVCVCVLKKKKPSLKAKISLVLYQLYLAIGYEFKELFESVPFIRKLDMYALSTKMDNGINI